MTWNGGGKPTEGLAFPGVFTGELAPREPSVEDLVQLCQEMNARGCLYLVVGGFAIIGAGYNRRTMDIDFLVEASLENEAKAYRAKDESDLVFLREYFKSRGEQPPEG